MQRKEIDAVLRETVANLLNSGAAAADVCGALAASRYDLQADAYRDEKAFPPSLASIDPNGPLSVAEAKVLIEARIFNGAPFLGIELARICNKIDYKGRREPEFEESFELHAKPIREAHRAGWIERRGERKIDGWRLTDTGHDEARRRAEAAA